MDFDHLKTQRNARILLAKAKFEPLYLFLTRNMYFEPKSIMKQHLDFELSNFPLYQFEIYFELTLISNSTIGD